MNAPAPARAFRPEIELLDDRALHGLGEEWAQLWHRCAASPFQHPAWLLPWARHHAPGRLGAAALRVEGRLAGLAPVFVWQGTLLLAGTGPSDLGDWLLPGEAEEVAVDLLAAMLEAAPGPFERVDLRQLPPRSSLARAAAPAGWSGPVTDDDPCLVAPLEGADGLAAASKKCRSNWRYAVRRIGREGGVLEQVAAGEVRDAMEDLARLHALRWEDKGESGVLADPLLDRTLRDAAPALSAAGLLRLWRVRLGGRTAAVLLVLAGSEAHHYYLGGFDPAVGAFSPSAALVGAAMAQAAREGASAFDFLRGAEPYKARWGARPRPTVRRLLERSG